jgi:hypothetical protein
VLLHFRFYLALLFECALNSLFLPVVAFFWFLSVGTFWLLNQFEYGFTAVFRLFAFLPWLFDFWLLLASRLGRLS